MVVIEGRTYYFQEDIEKIVDRTPVTVLKMIADGRLEGPVVKLAIYKLWNEKQVERIKKRFGGGNPRTNGRAA